MKKAVLIAFCFVIVKLNAQAPKLHLTLTSHNEMLNTGTVSPEPYDTDQSFYNKTRDTLKLIADMVLAKNAKYNLQTCQRFVYATHKWDSAGYKPNDILEYCYKLGGAPYGNVVEIDPRDKTSGANMVSPIAHTLNIADVVHMIDSTGAVASKTKGGFLYYPYAGQDWSQYTYTITGTKYGKKWKADILWGAGSNPPHSHDANNYGVWKPSGHTDSVSFYCHNQNQNVWVQGNGCAWVLYDTTTNIQWIIRDIRSQATKINNGTYPANKFYGASLMINFKHFQSPNFRKKLTQIIDSINVLVGQNKAVWSTINQKQNAFYAWSSSNSIPFTQWACGQTTSLTTCNVTGLNSNLVQQNNAFQLYPNPAASEVNLVWEGQLNDNTYYCIYDQLGKLIVKEHLSKSITKLDLQKLNSGIYVVEILNDSGKVLPKKLVIN